MPLRTVNFYGSKWNFTVYDEFVQYTCIWSSFRRTRYRNRRGYSNLDLELTSGHFDFATIINSKLDLNLLLKIYYRRSIKRSHDSTETDVLAHLRVRFSVDFSLSLIAWNIVNIWLVYPVNAPKDAIKCNKK